MNVFSTDGLLQLVELSTLSRNASTLNTATTSPACRTRNLLALALSLATALVTTAAYAWGSQGHQVVAGLALAQLTPQARAETVRLLALEPGETLMSISTWADEHRNPATAPWHYVNFPRDSCSFDAARDCPDGQCVVGAIERQALVLASNAPDTERLKALKYVVHLVGDVYQPLHAGYKDDKGGNTYQLQVFNRGSNLHALWDSGIIMSRNEGTTAMTARLSNRAVPSPAMKWRTAQAAEMSCQIVGAPGFYPAREVQQDYVERFTPVVEKQLIGAGASLANLLNASLR